MTTAGETDFGVLVNTLKRLNISEDAIYIFKNHTPDFFTKKYLIEIRLQKFTFIPLLNREYQVVFIKKIRNNKR